MKKKCSGCRAQTFFSDDPVKCLLGHRTGTYFKGAAELQKPLEECPKPITYEDLYRLQGKLPPNAGFPSKHEPKKVSKEKTIALLTCGMLLSLAIACGLAFTVGRLADDKRILAAELEKTSTENLEMMLDVERLETRNQFLGETITRMRRQCR